jgi:hypothetical protein
MASHRDSTPPASRSQAKRKPGAAHGRRKLVRNLAQGTLLAAGFAVARFGVVDVETVRVFDLKMVDKLHMPLTRFRES